MKIQFHIYISIISILLFAKISWAQDFHLSHYDANPLYLNPGLTGMRLEEAWLYRFNINYREQKGNFLGRSNKIIASGFDMPLNNKFSLGEFVINNKTINGSINTLNVMLSGAYKITHKDPEGNDRHNISVGLQVGLIQKSFNPANFVYDSQYSPSSSSGFDESLPSGENYVKQSVSKFDMNMGVYYRYVNKFKKYSPFGGFSIYHLSTPNQSFTDIHSQTPMRFTLHGGCSYKFNEAYSILPQFLYMNQAHASELNVGIMAFDKIRCTDYEPMLGFSLRLKNAYIVHVGLKYKTYFFRVSYDVNTYYLKQYGNRGMEFSIVYTPKKKTAPVDLVATLMINDSALVKDSSALMKPVLSDASTIQKQPMSNTATPADSTQSLPGKKTITTIIHDTVIIIEKTVVHFKTVEKDTAITVSPKIASESYSPVKPIITVVHDTVFLPSKLAPTVSPILKDSTKNIKENGESLAPVMNAQPVYAEIPKNAPGNVASNKPSVPIVSPKKSYRVQLGVFKENRPAENANKFSKITDQQVEFFKNSKGNTIYTVGDFPNRDEALNLKIEMIKKGYTNAQVVEVSSDTPITPLKQKKQSAIVPIINKPSDAIGKKTVDTVVATKNLTVTKSVVKDLAIQKQPADPNKLFTADSAAYIEVKNRKAADSLAVNNSSYRVQVGAFKKLIPVETANKFIEIGAKGIKNLNGKKDYTVYSVGDYPSREEAMELKNTMIEQGYTDAFIIATPPDAPLISIEKLIISSPKEKDSDKQDAPPNAEPKYTYMVQLGAFKKELPSELANKMMELGSTGIKNLKDSDGYTVYVIGNFTSRAEAYNLKNEMVKRGFEDAFIIRIPPEEATDQAKTKRKGKTFSFPKQTTKVKFK